MSKKDLQRACPVCQNAKRGEVLHTQKFILSENHILPKEYNVVACSKCGFVYVDTSTNQDVYDNLVDNQRT